MILGYKILSRVFILFAIFSAMTLGYNYSLDTNYLNTATGFLLSVQIFATVIMSGLELFFGDITNVDEY